MGEESREQDVTAASYKWWLDSQTTQPHQSQWLQATLSDLDEKIIKMVNLMEGDGDSFTKRAEMYYSSRPRFIRMLQDLHKLYRSIAEKYDQLCYEPVSGSNKNLHSRRKKSLENAILEVSIFNPNYEMLNRKQETDGENWVDVHKLEQDDDKWSEISLKISDLINENKKQQAEFIRRNEEKRKEIKALYDNIDKLMEENKHLKDKMARWKADMNQNQSHLSKLKRMILGKLLN